MGDLYQYASGSIFGFTFCAPLRKGGVFYAALCYDIKITSKAIPFQAESTKGSPLFEIPLILQQKQDEFFNFLEKLALGEEDKELVDDMDLAKTFKIKDVIESKIYNATELKTGTFSIPVNPGLED